MARVWRENAPLYEPLLPGLFPQQADFIEELGLSPRYDSHVVELDGVPIGTVGLALVTKRLAYVAALYLLPEWQGRGLGAEVVASIVRQLPRSVEAIVLHAHPGAWWALRFYERQGFVPWRRDEPLLAGALPALDAFAPPGVVLLGRRR